MKQISPARSLAILVVSARGNAIAPVVWAAETQDAAVVNGQQALTRSGRYPWYDRDRDALQPVVAPQETTASSWSWNFNPAPYWGELLRIGVWIAFALLIAWLIHLLTRIYLQRETARALTTTAQLETAEDPIQIDALPALAQTAWHELLAQAQRAFEQGRYREAMIYLFSHQLLELNRQQVIYLAKGKTNRQYLREVQRQSTLAPLFEKSIELFELAFFGNQALSREQFERAWRDQISFERQLGVDRATA